MNTNQQYWGQNNTIVYIRPKVNTIKANEKMTSHSMPNSTFRRRRWLTIIRAGYQPPPPTIAIYELKLRPIVVSTDENGEKELDVG